MYALRNKVQLIGILGDNPTIRELSNGEKYARFTLSTTESFNSKNKEKVTETQWHTLVATGKVADLCELHLSKGSEIAIEGKLTHRQYEDKDGKQSFVTEVQVRELLLLNKKVPKSE